MDQAERCLVGAPEMREAAGATESRMRDLPACAPMVKCFSLSRDLQRVLALPILSFASRKHILGPTGRGANTQQCVYAWP